MSLFKKPALSILYGSKNSVLFGDLSKSDLCFFGVLADLGE